VRRATRRSDDVSALSDLLDKQPIDERAAAYDALAEIALRAFGATAHEVVFLGHNSGAAYRAETARAGRLLLKVHAPQGDSEGLSAPAILGGLQWLAAMAEVTDLPVQRPLPDPSGALLPSVSFRGLSLPCSLQRWLDGQQVEALSTDQAHRVGDLLGRWHAFSEGHATTAAGAVRYDGLHLAHALDDLRVLSTSGAIANDSWHTIEQAVAQVRSLMDALGTSPDVFGVVHGDLNPDNIIVAGDGSVQFIDLAQLVLAPYLWDLGTALYQYSYQDASVRRALMAGYREARPRLTIPPHALEAFVCAAALDNLAFQCSIPTQRTSRLFHTNVQKFATGYCRDFVNGMPFALE
jgi:Ser/Thr protein kinase RdoA (MazF antagonist)